MASQGAAGPTYKVQISGLPNKLLTEIMMEAVLEQAGLDDVLDLNLRPGKPAGSMVVTFASTEMVERCVWHFTGRQWDPSGATVAVNVLSSTGYRPQANGQHAAVRGSPSLKAQDMTTITSSIRPKAGPSADAPAFFPTALAPAFIPSALLSGLAENKAVVVAGTKSRLKAGVIINSDTSTEVGESEAEDDQDTLVSATA
jgi:hypothetical protein